MVYVRARFRFLNAVQLLTKRQASLEARSHGIRINAVSPGFLLTKLLDPFMQQNGGADKDELWQKYEARQGRKATFEEIGDVVVLLSLPRMSLVVGHNLVIDGYVYLSFWIIRSTSVGRSGHHRYVTFTTLIDVLLLVVVAAWLDIEY